MEKLKCKVIMLPQPQQRSDFTILSKQLSNGKLVLGNGRIFGEATPQHLYFISDRGSKKGEWTLFGNSLNGELKDFIGGKPIKAKYDYGSNGIYNFKIEATTDKSLDLPPIPNSFIEEYVQKEGKIKEVNIEMDGSFGFHDSDTWWEPKTKGKEREVIILPTKDSWNKEEIKALYDEWIKESAKPRQNTSMYFHEWLDNNY